MSSDPILQWMGLIGLTESSPIRLGSRLDDTPPVPVASFSHQNGYACRTPHSRQDQAAALAVVDEPHCPASWSPLLQAKRPPVPPAPPMATLVAVTVPEAAVPTANTWSPTFTSANDGEVVPGLT